MDSDLLQRARLLIDAANSVSAATANIGRNMGSPDSANILDASLDQKDARSIQKLNFSPKKRSEETSTIAGESNFTTAIFGAAIKGSQLVTTYGDIRKRVDRGSTLEIGGSEYKISTTGEWSANRIQLEEDYRGETDLNIAINISRPSPGKKKPSKRTAVHPVPSEDILGAVAALDIFSQIASAKTEVVNAPQKSKRPSRNTPSAQAADLSSFEMSQVSTSSSRRSRNGRRLVQKQVPPKKELVDDYDVHKSVEEKAMLEEIRHQELYEQDAIERRRAESNLRMIQRVCPYISIRDMIMSCLYMCRRAPAEPSRESRSGGAVWKRLL